MFSPGISAFFLVGGALAFSPSMLLLQQLLGGIEGFSGRHAHKRHKVRTASTRLGQFKGVAGWEIQSLQGLAFRGKPFLGVDRGEDFWRRYCRNDRGMGALIPVAFVVYPAPATQHVTHCYTHTRIILFVS